MIDLNAYPGLKGNGIADPDSSAHPVVGDTFKKPAAPGQPPVNPKSKKIGGGMQPSRVAPNKIKK